MWFAAICCLAAAIPGTAPLRLYISLFWPLFQAQRTAMVIINTHLKDTTPKVVLLAVAIAVHRGLR